MILSYVNDIFFHYALSGEDKDSAKLRELLIFEIVGEHFQTKILNPALVPNFKDEKYPILDILAKSKTGEMINIEMQVSLHTEKQSKRFQYYGAKTLASQLKEGDGYEKLKRVIQIIFIKDKSDELIKLYTSKDRYGKDELYCLNYRYYVYFPMIEDILKVKQIDELSELEKLCYLFMYNQNNDILIDNEGLVYLMSKKYWKIKESSAIWSIAQHREDQIRYTMMMEQEEEERRISIEKKKREEEERTISIEKKKREEEERTISIEKKKREEEERTISIEKKNKELEEKSKVLEVQKRNIEDGKKQLNETNEKILLSKKELAETERKIEQTTKELNEKQGLLDNETNRLIELKSQSINFVKQMLKLKFSVQDLDWVEQLTSEQLSEMVKLALITDSYPELKSKFN